MSSGVTVVGLVNASHVLEDISIEVPYRVAVPIPPALALRSRDLRMALEEKKVLALHGALPAGASFRGLGPVLRAPSPKARPVTRRPPPPPPSAPAPSPSPSAPVAVDMSPLLQEALDNQSKILAAVNSLQGRLQFLAEQLDEVRDSLKRIESRPAVVATTVGSATLPSLGFEGGDAPHFIPEQIRDDSAQVNIHVEEQKAPSSLGSAKSALKNLRKKNS